MLQLLTNKGLILSLLIILNLLAFFLFKSNPRFIRGPIFILLFLIFGFVIYRHLISPVIFNRIEVERKSLEASSSANSPDQIGQGIQFTDRIIQNKQASIAIFNIASWQVFFVIFFSLLGLVFTDDKKTYLSYGLFFVVIGVCVVYAMNT